MPKTVSEWKEIEKRFFQHWSFPRCLGAIDRKHIVINRPPCSGSAYFNFKKEHIASYYLTCLMLIIALLISILVQMDEKVTLE